MSAVLSLSRGTIDMSDPRDGVNRPGAWSHPSGGLDMTDRTCSVDGCERPLKARGLCNTHNERRRLHGTTDLDRPTVAERFWSKVNKTETCWLWMNGQDGHGYGQFNVGDNKRVLTHRWAYEDAYGPIPAGLDLDHLCRTPLCCRPDHLEAVTRRVNLLRGATISAANAAKTHCPQGHAYDERNTSISPRGTRRCRACWRASNHRRKGEASP